MSYKKIIIYVILIISSLSTTCKFNNQNKQDFDNYNYLIQSANSIIQSRQNIDSLYIIAEILSESNNDDLLAYPYKFKGLFYFFKRQNDYALTNYELAENLFKTNKNYLEFANILNNQGVIYLNQNQFEMSLHNFLASAQVKEEFLDNENVEMTYLNIGAIYARNNNYSLALNFFQKALELSEKNNNEIIEVNALINLITISNTLGKIEEALNYAYRAEEIANKLLNPYYLASIYNNLATVYEEKRDYDKSLFYYLESLEIRLLLEEFENVVKIYNNIAHIYILKNDYINAKKSIDKSLEFAEDYNIDLSNITNLNLIAEYFLKSKKFQQSALYYQKSMEVFFKSYQEDIHNSIAELQIKYDTERKDNEILLLKQSSEINELKYKHQKILFFTAILFLIFLAILTYFIYKQYMNKMKANILISRERELSEKLLKNTLPDKVVLQLKEKGQFLPEIFNNCSVLFADIVEFTKISEKMNPVILISELNEIFTEFDNIFDKYYCERIKTNGDCYIGVCGLPTRDINHSDNLLNAVIEMKSYLIKRNMKNSIKWNMRFGLHSGVVIGAIVGIKKYIFDIFGDTVNTTARIQNLAEPMEIIVTEEFYNNVNTVVEFNKKGSYLIKGKGECNVYIVG